MCAISGIISPNSSEHNHKKRLQKMLDVQSHRGPDGQGISTFSNGVIGHRRLSIVDLSLGKQPFVSSDNKTILTFNGEIYGYKEIKRKLTKDYSFKTNSDTEVIIALYKKYGQKLLKYLPGMFAFAIWDKNKKQLFAARDRFGEKPFYYAISKDGDLIFSSEIKAILASGLLRPILDKQSLSYYLQHLVVPSNKTIYKNIHVLPPAHYLLFNEGKIKISRYWSFPEINDQIELGDAVKELRRLFSLSVKNQLVADVPIAAFLSGGLDSSTVVSEAVKYSPKINTLSFGFENSKSELPYARAVADKYKTNFIELNENDYDIASLIQEMAYVYDEPFADSSSIPTYLISKQARKYATVVLTGDGGDELLGGYHSYLPYFWNDQFKYDFMGKGLLLNVLSKLARKLPTNSLNRFQGMSKGYHLEHKYHSYINAHHTTNQYFDNESLNEFRLDQYSSWYSPSWKTNNTVNDVMRMDVETYMPGDILTKIDRASMAHGLELRAPFLDVDLASFCLSLPSRLKINSGQQKHILKEAYKNEWPQELFNRPKLGFGSPVDIWLQDKKMNKLIEKYLLSKKKKINLLFDKDVIKKYSVRKDYQTWILLTLSLWMENYEFDF